LREVKGVLRSGYCEILLTTQDTAAYGLDLNMNLPELLNSITALEGEFKIRVGMMNPANTKRILPELLKAYESEKIYKFLHLPVQSGDDRVLATMRRGYTVKDFLRIVRAFRQKFPNLYLATDVIVGFPGESEEEFMRTCELIEKVKPDKTNVSRFSPLPGTDAARMPQLDGREIARRSRVMSELCRRITYEQNRLYVRQTVRGLVTERGWKGGYIVRLPNYKLAILQNAGLGDFINVKITAAKPTYLLAEKVN
jgi:MiaB/RimO family radical SAM methylthiotransferase